MKKIYPLILDNITPESKAINGFLKDNTLDDLIETYMGNLLGDSVFTFFQGNLPITVQIKDTQLAESSKNGGRGPVLVSPDDQTALPRYDCWGKERMLYILSAQKGSSIWIGFEKSISATDIYERCQKGNIIDAMNEIEPEEGETFYIRPGVPFCIGSGVRYVEVAQNSPVELDITDMEQMVEALDFIRLDAYIPEYVAPEDCLFRMERVAITKPQTIAPDQTESFMAIVNLDNQTSLTVKDIRALPGVTEENCAVLSASAKDRNPQTNTQDGNSQTNAQDCNPPGFMVMIPHDIRELTISPSQECNNPSSSFLRIYMCNIPQPPKDDEDNRDDDHCHDDHCHDNHCNDHCGCDEHHSHDDDDCHHHPHGHCDDHHCGCNGHHHHSNEDHCGYDGHHRTDCN